MANTAELGIKYTSNIAGFVKGANQVKQALTDTAPAAKKASTFIDLFKGRLRDASAHASKFSQAMGKLRSSIGRIAFYRAIRSGIKEITQAFREGIGNLYQYSAALNSIDAGRAKATMDGFATTALYVKNSLGAALMPILQRLLPIVNWVADGFVKAANAVNQFWSAIQGKSIFTRAKKQATEFGEALGGAAGSAKELKKQIFGFDELNIFNEPSGGGGGGASGLDYSGMFEEAEIEGIFKRLRDALERNLGADFKARFAINWKDILFNWDDLNAEQIGAKMLTGLYALLGGITGFGLAGPAGAIVGTLAGAALGVYFSTIDLNGDGVLSQNEILSMICDVGATLTGAVVGWAIGGPQGALIGLSVFAGITAITKALDVQSGDFTMGLAFAGLVVGVLQSITHTSGVDIALSSALGIPGPWGAVGLALVGGILITVTSLAKLKNELGNQTQFITAAIVECLNLAAGALIGFAVGGPLGAAIGITIAAGLNVLMNSVGFDMTPEAKRQTERFVVDQGAMDAYNAGGYKGVQYYNTSGSSKEERRKLLQGFADGGIVDTGTLFYAGEAGPELVGQVGGRTTVTNQDQFTAGMEGIMDNTNTVILQAAQALISAIQNKDMTAVVNVGDRQIVSAYDRGKRLAGAGLVE